MNDTRMERWAFPAVVIVVLGLLALKSAWAAAPALPAYVVLGGSGALARVAIDGAGNGCPTLSVDGRTLAMAVRPIPPALQAAFPVTVCEALLPAGARQASLGSQNLPLPPQAVNSVAALGDTGCRLKADKSAGKKSGKKAAAAAGGRDADHADDGGKFQDCNVPASWPFAAVAAQAAATGPDLVLHVGDYLYRESKCPQGDSGCAGSPHKDDWATWQADFFVPAAPLLARAPWIAVRGNHETCARAGYGYQILLDPRPAAQIDLTQCADIAPSYQVTAGGQTYVVIDTSNADDLCDAKTPCNSADYAPLFAALAPPPGSWLVTHKPIWSVRKGPKIVTAALQAALPQGRLPSGIALALAGHIHFWQALSFADGRAPQFVLGNGGTLPAGKVKGALAGLPIAGTTVSQGRIVLDWGFTLFSRATGGWNAAFSGVRGQRFNCAVTNGRIEC